MYISTFTCYFKRFGDYKKRVAFTHKIDFEALFTALKKVDYQGDIMLEIDSFFANVPTRLLLSCGKLAAEVGRYIREKLQK